MIKSAKTFPRKLVFLSALLIIQASIAFAQNSISIAVDGSDAAKSILHVREKMARIRGTANIAARTVWRRAIFKRR